MALYYYLKYTKGTDFEYSNETYWGSSSQTLSSPQSVYGVEQGGVTWSSSSGYYYTKARYTYTCPTNGYVIIVDRVESDIEFRR